MKQYHFSTVLKLSLSTLTFIFVITSCEKKAIDVVAFSNSKEVADAKALKPSSLPTISLRVTVNDAAGNNITSDGRGDYINGIDKVQAIIDQSGTFAFNTNTSSRLAAIRWVTYNFNNPVDPANTYRPSPSNSKNYHISTGSSPYGTSPFIPLQNLGVNGNPATECIYMGNGLYNSTTAWRVSFHKGLEDTQTSPTAFAIVTRVSLTQWTITPMGTCSPNSNVASLRNDANNTLYGYYYIPFSFTLTKL